MNSERVCTSKQCCDLSSSRYCHAVGSDKMISDSQSDADDDDDTEDEDDRTQPQTAANTSDDDGTTSTVSADAVDSCEVCFVAPRDARFALVRAVISVSASRVLTQCTTKAVAVLLAAHPSQWSMVLRLY